MSPADFAGVWQVGRVITDARAGQAGRFDGQAVLSAVGTGMSYDETGRLQIGPGPVMTATRRYSWAFQGGVVQVSFGDGRPFHSFMLGVSGAGTDHLCGGDLYRVTYGFAEWPVWTAVWDVSGPRKAYSLVSRFWR